MGSAADRGRPDAARTIRVRPDADRVSRRGGHRRGARRARRSAAATDWPLIVSLYDRLMRGRAVAGRRAQPGHRRRAARWARSRARRVQRDRQRRRSWRAIRSTPRRAASSSCSRGRPDAAQAAVRRRAGAGPQPRRAPVSGKAAGGVRGAAGVMPARRCAGGSARRSGSHAPEAEREDGSGKREQEAKIVRRRAPRASTH